MGAVKEDAVMEGLRTLVPISALPDDKFKQLADSLTVEQLGSGNIIGGIDAVAGTMTALDLDGTAMTLDINQIGDSNKFLGDITADSYTGFFEFDGNSNTFNMNTDKTNTYGADSSNVNVDVDHELYLNVYSRPETVGSSTTIKLPPVDLPGTS